MFVSNLNSAVPEIVLSKISSKERLMLTFNAIAYFYMLVWRFVFYFFPPTPISLCTLPQLVTQRLLPAILLFRICWYMVNLAKLHFMLKRLEEIAAVLLDALTDKAADNA
ncbi:hypothetical protein BDQ17DRAFT_1374499 [Cyathus striatus]|nr:hypothetical protein BDQ17DRAFT_1374499 [Cyathus striatus]